MKKKLFVLTTSVLLALGCVGCGGGNAAEEPAPAPVLTGEWAQVNSNSEDSYHIATIKGDTIEIYWYTASDETKALYWAGDFVAPETADEPYTWTSTNDREKTDSALLASGDDTKEFTYEAGQISYEAGMMGVTQTMRLEKQ